MKKDGHHSHSQPWWRRGGNTRTLVVSLLIIVLLLGATTFLWHESGERLNADSQRRAARLLGEVKSALQERVSIYSYILDGTKAFFEASDNVTRKDFNNFFISHQLKEEHQGFSSINYIAKVPASQKQSFTAAARADTSYPEEARPSYTIYPTATRDFYYPVLYSARGTSPLTLDGFDVASSEQARARLDAIGATNQVSVSATLNLNGSDVSKSDERPGFSMSVPVYSQPNFVPGIAPKGFLLATFEHKYILEGLLGVNSDEALLRIFDQKEGGALIFQEGDSTILDAGYNTQVQENSIGGQTWRLELYTRGDFATTTPDRNMPRIIAISGLIITGLVLALYLSKHDSRRR